MLGLKSALFRSPMEPSTITIVAVTKRETCAPYKRIVLRASCPPFAELSVTITMRQIEQITEVLFSFSPCFA